VWEKMGIHPRFGKVNDLPWCCFKDIYDGTIYSTSNGETIQEAACIATAKAILELG